jgi:hypothetical protein
MAFRTHSRDTVAKVLITAASPEQLDKILLALEDAVSSHGRPSTKRPTASVRYLEPLFKLK